MAKTIKMIRDFKVAPDGFTVETWAKGETHEVSDSLANDLTHPTTLAAIETTGDAKADAVNAAAATAALAKKQAAEAAAAQAMLDGAAKP